MRPVTVATAGAIMRIRIVALTVVVVLMGAFQQGAARQAATPRSGVDRRNMDLSARPQDDFFRYVNGSWLARTEIPADHTSIGSFGDLRDASDANVRTLIEEAARRPNRAPGSIDQQIGDLYTSFMNDARADQLGAAPIKAELDRIDAIKTPADLASCIGALAAMGVGGMDLSVAPDPKQPTVTMLAMGQSNITLMPDRDYYLKDDPKLAETRTKYQAYLEKVFSLVDRANPAADAKAVLALETGVARVQWPVAELRDAVKNYNPYTLARLRTEMPGFDWAGWASAQGLSNVTEINVHQPSFFKGYATLVEATPLAAWKAWLVAVLLSKEGPYLGKPFVDAHFDFFDRTLRGQQALRSRAERGVQLVNTSLGEAVGSVYVRRYFPAEAKTRMQRMVANLLEAYRQAIGSVDWMTPETRQRALDKLSKFMPQIGYPDTWRSYDSLQIAPDDLAGNVIRIGKFQRAYNRAKLGRPVDRAEWEMTPQTVNAYYSPPYNKIVFPAAILQPPFFQFDADDAVNYGAIGAVIGHEIGHGFDDQGRQFDGTGALHDWWVPADDREFRKRAQQLVEQFNAFTPLPGLHVNGQLTLGENIGDLAGLGIAYRAYKVSLAGKASPVIDGFTGEQRLFIGFAQIWRTKMRDEAMRVQVLSNPHSPGEYRANGPVSNVDAFYDAFGVKAGDKMFRPPAERVRIW
jgi:predicted metalloendopeptidase